MTLFVGDLPPFFTAEGLQAVFSQLARVMDVRVVGNKLFGFVTLESEAAAAYVLETSDTQGIYAEGAPLRVSRAHDGTTEWQQVRPSLALTIRLCTPALMGICAQGVVGHFSYIKWHEQELI